MIKRIITIMAAASFILVSCDNKQYVIDENDSAQIALKGTEISSAKELVNTIQSTINDLKNTQTQLSGYVDELKTKIGTASADNSQLKTTVESLEQSCSNSDTQLKNIQSSVDKGNTDLKKWISDSYATKEQLSTLSNTVSSINTSITTLSGKVENLDESSKSISSKLQKALGDLSSLISQITELEGRADKLEQEIAAIVSAVQSIVVVPDYSDGSVKMNNSNNNRIYFDIKPAAAAEKLAQAGKSCVSLDAVETISKASEIDQLNIPVSEVGYDGKYFYIVADGTCLTPAVKSGKKGANARLKVSNDVITRSSEYFQLSYSLTSGSINAIPSAVSELTVNFTGSTDIVSTDGTDVITYGILFTKKNDVDLYFSSVEKYLLNYDEYYYFKADEDGTISFVLDEYIEPNRQYRYRLFANKNGIYTYGDESTFTTTSTYTDLTLSNTECRLDGVKVNIGTKISIADNNFTASNVQILYGTDSVSVVNDYYGISRENITPDSEGNISYDLTRLAYNKKVYFVIRSEIRDKDDYFHCFSLSNVAVVENEYPEYVDLGLPSGNKWATYNIGADTPLSLGYNYTWGSTSSSIPFYNDGVFTKYNDVDGKTILEPEDDPAAKILGNGWRVPSTEDWDELFNPEYVEVSGFDVTEDFPYIFYQTFTSKVEGYTDKSIVIPATGWDFIYWTSEISPSDHTLAKKMQKTIYTGIIPVYNYNYRYSLAYTRPVKN